MKKIFPLLCAIFLLSGCGVVTKPQTTTLSQTSALQNQEQEIPDVNIEVNNFSFSPSELTIKIGTTVTWTNKDSMPHTVTVKDVFDTGELQTGQSASRTFGKPEVFDYICSFHPSMKGRVIVVN